MISCEQPQPNPTRLSRERFDGGGTTDNVAPWFASRDGGGGGRASSLSPERASSVLGVGGNKARRDEQSFETTDVHCRFYAMQGRSEKPCVWNWDRALYIMYSQTRLFSTSRWVGIRRCFRLIVKNRGTYGEMSLSPFVCFSHPLPTLTAHLNHHLPMFPDKKPLAADPALWDL